MSLLEPKGDLFYDWGTGLLYLKEKIFRPLSTLKSLVLLVGAIGDVAYERVLLED